MLDARSSMLGWAASFDLCSLTSTLGIGLRLVEHYGSERRSSFAFATARQVSACHAEACGVGGLGAFFFFPMYRCNSFNESSSSLHCMFAEIKKEVELVLAHVLFIDIVEYSKRLINDQRALLGSDLIRVIFLPITHCTTDCHATRISRFVVSYQPFDVGDARSHA